MAETSSQSNSGKLQVLDSDSQPTNDLQTNDEIEVNKAVTSHSTSSKEIVSTHPAESNHNGDNSSRNIENLPNYGPSYDGSIHHASGDWTTLEERALRFLRNPSTKDIPLGQKLDFLKNSCGLSRGEFNRILNTFAPLENTQQRLNDAFAESSDLRLDQSWHPPPPTSIPFSSPNMIYPPEQLNPFQGTPPPPPSGQTHFMNANPTPNPPHPDQWNRAFHPGQSDATFNHGSVPLATLPPPSDPTAKVALSALVGGAVAMFGMAAWRWINGGDFELCPPPRLFPASEDDSNTPEQFSANTEKVVTVDATTDAREVDFDALIFNNSDESQNAKSSEVATSISELARAIHDLKYSQEQRERKRASSNVTNNAMGLLRSNKASEYDEKLVHADTAQALKDLSDKLSNWLSNGGASNEAIRGEIRKITSMISQLSQQDTSDVDLPVLETSDASSQNDEPFGKQSYFGSKDCTTMESKTPESNPDGLRQTDITMDEVKIHKFDTSSEQSEPSHSDDYAAVNGNSSTDHPVNKQDWNASLPSGFVAAHMRKGSYTIMEEDVAHMSDETIQEVPASEPTSLEDHSKATSGSMDDSWLLEAMNNVLSQNENTPCDAFQSGVAMVNVYLTNIVKHPTVPRYRKINKANKGYQQHISSINGLEELLIKLKFEDISDTVLMWKPRDLAQDMETLRLASNELKLLKQRIQEQQRNKDRKHQRHVTPLQPPSLGVLMTPCNPTGLESPPLPNKKATIDSGLEGSSNSPETLPA